MVSMYTHAHTHTLAYKQMHMHTYTYVYTRATSDALGAVKGQPRRLGSDNSGRRVALLGCSLPSIDPILLFRVCICVSG